MYEAVAVDGRLGSVAARAEHLGYDGLVAYVTDPDEASGRRRGPVGDTAHGGACDCDRDGGPESWSASGSRVDFDLDLDLVAGVAVDADPNRATTRVRALREATTVLLVRGGTEARNRAAVAEPRVDVLLAPVGPESVPFDEPLAREAAHNGVRVAVDLGPVLRERGGTRVRAISALSRLHDILTTTETPYVVTASATGPLDLRAPRALVAVGEAVGLSGAFVRDGLREWARLVARNRARAADDWVMPGVRRGRYDPADWDGADAAGRAEDP